MYVKFVKRAIDIFLSLIGIVVAAPFMILIYIVVLLDTRSNPIFTQRRIGRNRVIFDVYKFKTMRDDAPHDLATDRFEHPELYITRTGRFLRRTSLDELPQLFNIFAGSMSTVGPRPALWNQYDLIEARERVGANAARPGLTGWAQINGRDMLTIEEKAIFDGEYARNVTWQMDAKCFFGSVWKVLIREGIREED